MSEEIGNSDELLIKTPTVEFFELTDAEIATFKNIKEASHALDETFKLASMHHSQELRKLQNQLNDFWNELVQRAGFDSTQDMHYHGYQATADFSADKGIVKIAEKDPWDNENWPKYKKV